MSSSAAARIHAERRTHLETVEDIALFHQAVRPEVTFVLGLHSPGGWSTTGGLSIAN